jgi:autotransporter strand-loop-strand O-heptosyltransferase
MPVIEKYRSDKQIDVYVIIKPEYVFLFDNSYPDLKFISDKTNLIFTEEKELEYDFTENIQYGYAKQLGYENWEYIRPKIIIEKKERPKLGKYVAISVHSTSQLKYWNHPLGREVQELSPNWTEICSRLRKKNLKPLILEKYVTFGQSPYFNGLPKKSNSRINLSLEELVNYIDHCEFFMGLSSGNAWIAHALGKKVFEKEVEANQKNNIQLNLSKGLYYIKLQGENYLGSTAIIIQ